MRLEDIPAVIEIERESFTTPWPVSAYRSELRNPRIACYIVVRELEDDDPLTNLEQAPPQAQRGPLESIRSFVRQLWPQEKEPSLELPGVVVGYSGMWLLTGEGHITTIAVHPSRRRRGLGELLLMGLFDEAIARQARWMTLEVRASNLVAQDLYRKYTFRERGVRRRYYTDNSEDAIIMWSEELTTPEMRRLLARLKDALLKRIEAYSGEPNGTATPPPVRQP
ncbi:MAG: ribosomal protein S18-alanine N-acetyltransferase [Chloroflexi bacterium]|nr:ribosomal protein S18-alanine N-acetyltransferase [Chloroflexota bacterium]